MTSSSRTNNFLRQIRSTPVISGAAAQVSYQQQLQHDLWNFRESSVSSREGTPSSLRGLPIFDELPDRAISTRKLCNQKASTPLSHTPTDAIKEAAYVGSFPVDEPTQEARAEYIKKHLTEKLNVKIAKPVLLAISLSGIKVCCGSGEAEELNNIVANAFKTAYLQQQQQNHPSSTDNSHASSLSFNDLIQSQIDRQNQEYNLANERRQEQLQNQLNRISTPRIDSLAQQRRERRLSSKKNLEEDDISHDEAVLTWAHNAVEKLLSSPFRNKSQHSSNQKMGINFSSSNDRISILNEVSDLCGISDDLSLIDNFLFGLSNQPGSPVSSIKDFVERNFVTLFGGEPAPTTSTMTLTLPSLHCRLALPEDLSPLDLEDQHQLSGTSFSTKENNKFDFALTPMESSFEPQRSYDREEEDGDDELEREDDANTKERSQISRERSLVPVSNNVENLSREYFSKNGRAEDLSDVNLSEAPWYQPGVPRDVALNKLLHQVNGTFVVRDSSTHPGCYALSIKVPKYDSPNEITHYLIVKTQRGTFKIKGLTKEWSSLTSLVLHHTIMRELLPCLLVLPSKQ